MTNIISEIINNDVTNLISIIAENKNSIVTENDLNLELEPLDNHSVLNNYYKFYFFMNEKHVNIHIYEDAIKLGFDPSRRVEFLFAKPYLFLNLTDSDKHGHAITRIDDKHMSISPKPIFDKIKFKPREPKRSNAKNSGITLYGRLYKFNDINGILLNMKECIE